MSGFCSPGHIYVAKGYYNVSLFNKYFLTAPFDLNEPLNPNHTCFLFTCVNNQSHIMIIANTPNALLKMASHTTTIAVYIKTIKRENFSIFTDFSKASFNIEIFPPSQLEDLMISYTVTAA